MGEGEADGSTCVRKMVTEIERKNAHFCLCMYIYCIDMWRTVVCMNQPVDRQVSLPYAPVNQDLAYCALQ